MTYYTDEDRRKAAYKRQLNQMSRELRASPEDAYDILGVSVPRVDIRPELSDFRLSEGVEDRLKFADEQYIAEEKSSRKVIASVVTIIVIGLIWYVFSQINETNHPENYLNGQLINSALGWWGGILTVGGLYGSFVLWPWVFDVKPKQTYEHTQFQRYKDTLQHYEYWKRRKNKNYWNNMTGHAFEEAVGNLFRDIGFDAQVSRRGGDGGIDIILQKGDRRVAVQCKRYKSSVGPHVIRDLWGTMRYLSFDEGCIVTTTGFTKGVVDFAKDKPIFLVDLNDILRATGENGGDYLRKQIGEVNLR